MTFWKKENYGDNKQDQWLPRVGQKGSAQISRAVNRALRDTATMPPCMSLYACPNLQNVHLQE